LSKDTVIHLNKVTEILHYKQMYSFIK